MPVADQTEQSRARNPLQASALYSPELAELICTRLSAGESLRAICRSEGMPSATTVRQWAAVDYAGFAAQYARARSTGLDAISEEILEIADTVRVGEKVEKRELGRVCSRCRQCVVWGGGWLHDADSTDICAGGIAERVTEDRITTGDMVERARLQIDARKWLLSKLKPGVYGDRAELQHTGAGGGPLEVQVTFVPAPRGDQAAIDVEAQRVIEGGEES